MEGDALSARTPNHPSKAAKALMLESDASLFLLTVDRNPKQGIDTMKLMHGDVVFILTTDGF